MAATGQDPRTRYRIEVTQRRCSVRSWYPITNRWNKIAIAHRARGGPAGPFHAGRAGQGNDWACGNDVAVCRADRLRNGERLGPVRLMPQTTAILPGGIP